MHIGNGRMQGECLMRTECGLNAYLTDQLWRTYWITTIWVTNWYFLLSWVSIDPSIHCTAHLKYVVRGTTISKTYPGCLTPGIENPSISFSSSPLLGFFGSVLKVTSGMQLGARGIKANIESITRRPPPSGSKKYKKKSHLSLSDRLLDRLFLGIEWINTSSHRVDYHLAIIHR